MIKFMAGNYNTELRQESQNKKMGFVDKCQILRTATSSLPDAESRTSRADKLKLNIFLK